VLFVLNPHVGGWEMWNRLYKYVVNPLRLQAAINCGDDLARRKVVNRKPVQLYVVNTVKSLTLLSGKLRLLGEQFICRYPDWTVDHRHLPDPLVRGSCLSARTEDK